MSTPNTFLRTNLQWEDLVIPAATANQVQDILTWINTQPSRNEEIFGKQTHPGYKALFYGGDNKTKTLTAALIGKVTGIDVISLQLLDLVAIDVEKTEKNFDIAFEIAKQHHHILFFEDAITLFDEAIVPIELIISLIQHILEFPGLVIMTSNSKANIPKALAENLQSAINFG